MSKLLPLLLALLASCAAHNSHVVQLAWEADMLALVDAALLDLEQDLGQPLPGQMLLVVDVDELDVSFQLGPQQLYMTGQLRLELEDHLKQRLGDSLVLAPRSGDFWQVAEHMLQVRILLDLHAMDALGLQARALLVEREHADRAQAAGWSPIHIMERPFCHGCRDWSFRDKGLNLSFGKGSSEGFLYLGPHSVFHSHQHLWLYPSSDPEPIYRNQR